MCQVVHTVDTGQRAVDQLLGLPVRRKVVLLRELCSDLEGLEAKVQAEGLAPRDARAFALNLLTPTDRALADLVSLHSPWYARLTRSIPSRAVRILEAIGIGGMAVAAIFSPLHAYARSTSLSVWTAGTLGTLAVIVAAHLMWCAFQVLIREEADAASLVRAGAIQAGLLVLTLGIGASSVTLEVFSSVEQALGGDVIRIAQSVATCAETAALALGIAMLGLFGTCAVLGAYVLAEDIEEEYRSLLERTNPLHEGGTR